MEHIVHLFLVLAMARLFGRLAHRVGQASLLGEILGGVLLALVLTQISDVPVLSGLLNGLLDSPVISITGDIGVFFLLLAAGIEMEPKEISDHSKEAFVVALGGMAVPMALGAGLAWAVLPESEMKTGQALVVGTALSISAVPVAARVFMDFGLMHHAIGEIVISAAVFDDVFGFVMLAVITSLVAAGHMPDGLAVLLILSKLALFFALTIAFTLFVYPRVWRWVNSINLPGSRFSVLIVIALGFSILAESLGMHFVLGPFMAGLFFETSRVGEQTYVGIKRTVDNMTMGVLGPFFFAYIGLQLDVQAAFETPVFLAGLIALAFVGKIFGAGMSAYWCGLPKRDALAIGVGMNGRGAVELIFASIALQAGVFAVGEGPIVANLFSALVITAVVTTAGTPVLLKWALAARGGAS
jgi:Kef-type K+ transport system membrane component KefB